MKILNRSAARARGLTMEVVASSSHVDLHLLVRPDEKLDDLFPAWGIKQKKLLFVEGWLYEVDAI